MCIVNEAVQDRVGVGRIVYGLMPAGHGKLADDEGGALTVSILEDFEQMVPGVAVERLKTLIVQDQQIDPGKVFHASSDTAVTLGQGKFLDQPRQLV